MAAGDERRGGEPPPKSSPLRRPSTRPTTQPGSERWCTQRGRRAEARSTRQKDDWESRPELKGRPLVRASLLEAVVTKDFGGAVEPGAGAAPQGSRQGRTGHPRGTWPMAAWRRRRARTCAGVPVAERHENRGCRPGPWSPCVFAQSIQASKARRWNAGLPHGASRQWGRRRPLRPFDELLKFVVDGGAGGSGDWDGEPEAHTHEPTKLGGHAQVGGVPAAAQAVSKHACNMKVATSTTATTEKSALQEKTDDGVACGQARDGHVSAGVFRLHDSAGQVRGSCKHSVWRADSARTPSSEPVAGGFLAWRPHEARLAGGREFFQGFQCRGGRWAKCFFRRARAARGPVTSSTCLTEVRHAQKTTFNSGLPSGDSNEVVQGLLRWWWCSL